MSVGQINKTARFNFLYVINHLQLAIEEIRTLNILVEQLVGMIDMTDDATLEEDDEEKLLN